MRRKYRSKGRCQNGRQALRKKSGRRFGRTDYRQQIGQNRFVCRESARQLVEQQFARLHIGRRQTCVQRRLGGLGRQAERLLFLATADRRTAAGHPEQLVPTIGRVFFAVRRTARGAYARIGDDRIGRVGVERLRIGLSVFVARAVVAPIAALVFFLGWIIMTCVEI